MRSTGSGFLSASFFSAILSSMGPHNTAMKTATPAIPRGVWVLGFVSLLMDFSSEMIHALLPLYLTVGLGASALVVGLIEGVAEATAMVVKVFSGVLSDRWRNR